jgi:hypothetical protein
MLQKCNSVAKMSLLQKNHSDIFATVAKKSLLQKYYISLAYIRLKNGFEMADLPTVGSA